MSRSAEPDAVFLPYKANANLSQFKFFQLDLNNDLESIMSVIHDYKPAFIVNFAAQSMVGESWFTPEHWYQTNVVANVRLHDRLRQLPFLKKYVHVSTPEVYGSCAGDVQENAPFNPSTPYAVSRAACDMHLMSFFRNYRFPVNFTRAANVFGAGQQLYRIVPRTILRLKTGRKLQLHGGGHSVRSFIHIDDVADGTYRVATSAPAGEAYHFSTPVQVSIRKVVEMICDDLRVPFDECVEIVDDRPGKDAAYRLDSHKAQTQLGWAPKISLEQGLAETTRWIEQNLAVIKEQPQDYLHKA
jgi:dTDP-glucose 4,6-dehydratase